MPTPHKTKTFCVIMLIAVLIIAGCDSHHKGDIVYVAIGASDAVGIGATPLTDGYVYRIRDHIEGTGRGVQLVNLGIPDAQVGAFHDIEAPLARKADPDLITIFAGPNDITAGNTPSAFEFSLNTLLKDLTQHTSAVIIIATIPDISQTPRFRDSPDANVTTQRVALYNRAIRNQANIFGLAIADLSAQAVIDREIGSDNFHPNSAGYEHIANTFFAVIEPLLPMIGAPETQAVQ